jgi:hypothetical protein
MPAGNRLIRNMIRKITPVVFLIIFFMPVSTVYFLFRIRQTGIHQAVEKLMDEGLDEHKLIVLKIPLSVEEHGDFERTEENEFKYQGRMYDVARSEKHGSVTWYWCMWDEDETELENTMQIAKGKAAGTDTYNAHTEEVITIFLNSLYLHLEDYEVHLPLAYLTAVRPAGIFIPFDRTTVPPSPPPEI